MAVARSRSRASCAAAKDIGVKPGHTVELADIDPGFESTLEGEAAA